MASLQRTISRNIATKGMNKKKRIYSKGDIMGCYMDIHNFRRMLKSIKKEG